MAGLSGFGFYKEITVSHANADADLTNFPVYIPIVADADIGGECRADGFDVQFADATNDNVLTFERLPGFAVASGEASGDFYVLVPTVAGASDTVIRCYYGDADASDASSPANTFLAANGWSGVWHLEETSNPYLDSTSNDNDSDAGVYPDEIAGKVGVGQDFEKDDGEGIRFATSASLNLGTSDFTISLWIKPETVTTSCLITKRWNTVPYHHIFTISDGSVEFYMEDASSHSCSRTSAGSIITAGNWHHIYLTVDRDSATGYKAAINGTALTVSNPTAVLTLDNALSFYISDYDSYPFDGIMDEVRVSKSFLGIEWGKFEYYNSHDGHAAGNELTWGAEVATEVPVVNGPIKLRWTK